MPADATPVPQDALARSARIRFLAAAFRRILLVVLLIFIFAIVQIITLRVVCGSGMQTARLLEHQGLPALKELASLQENLAIYRLHSYEFLFAQKTDRPAKRKAAETDAGQIHAELAKILTLFPDGHGRQLAANLETAVDDLDGEFQMVRRLTDSDFNAAMDLMDREIPPRTDRVASTAEALKNFGYRFSGGQASATFGSFGWIQTSAITFGAGNILVAFGAGIFVLLAARSSRAQLSETLARLDERTQDLQKSNAVLERRETELRVLFNFLPALLCLKDAPQSLPARANQRLADSLGQIRGRAGGESRLPKSYPQSCRQVLGGGFGNHPLGRRQDSGSSSRFQDQENKTVWVQTDKIPVRDHDGKVIGLIVMCQDITARKRLEEQLIQVAANGKHRQTGGRHRP
jgi:PAS domain S-box-containing protein